MEVFDDVTHYLMPWHTFWHHDELFNVFTSRRIFSFHDVFHDLTFLFIILGTKYYENVFLMSLKLWYILYFMVNLLPSCFWWIFWRHGKFVDVMTCFWLHDTLFLTYISCHDKSFNVTACFWWHWHILTYL